MSAQEPSGDRHGRRAALALAVALAALAEGCARAPLAAPVGRSAAFPAAPEQRPPTEQRPPRATEQRPPAEQRPRPATESPPVTEELAFADLEVPGFGPAVVVLPRGGGPRPVLVATHGAGDRPEWHCDVWGAMVRGAGYVLCPRGKAIDTRVPDDARIYYYPDHHALGREVTAALSALSRRFGDRVDLRAPVYAGYSQGATMGALVLPGHPAGFARAALVEGGYGGAGEWTLGSARRWRGAGGARVLLACGRADCAARAHRTRETLERGGLTARVVHAKGAGHSYGGAMERALHEAYPWVIGGDPRWLGGSEASARQGAAAPQQGAAAP
ncbi:hypothetical protein WMF31_00045 [Sorangium sp. So ce1036]|uniref:alpha/beta hydrolase n=1 Tax=Sorangium sp. So ce1036 TaxID=3133328 RepID=UPI003F048A92